MSVTNSALGPEFEKYLLLVDELGAFLKARPLINIVLGFIAFALTAYNLLYRRKFYSELDFRTGKGALVAILLLLLCLLCLLVAILFGLKLIRYLQPCQ